MPTPDPVRVLHVTDPHLFADAGGAPRGTVTHDTLSAVVDDIRRQDWPADVLAMTGDLIQDDSAEAYDRFREIIEPLNLPIHCVPGNHDVRPLMQEKLRGPPFHYCNSLEFGNWLITGIDSCREGSAGGRIDDAELERLRSILAGTRAEHVAVCLHHPPVRMGSRWLDRVGLENAADFLETVIGAGNVRVAIFGHVHQVFDEYRDSVRIIGTPSSCAQFKPFSDEFALDDKPPAYRRISLNADGSVEAELVWLGEDQ